MGQTPTLYCPLFLLSLCAKWGGYLWDRGRRIRWFWFVPAFMLGYGSVISCLGCSQNFNLQSIVPCGKFGHLSAFCPVAVFPSWLLPPFSIFSSTKQFYLALLLHIKWTEHFSKMCFPFLCSSYTACHRRSYQTFINGVLIVLSVSPSMFSCLSSWWLIVDLIDRQI